MPNKLIIDNRTELSDIEAMRLATTVIINGQISKDGTQYCYCTTMTSTDGCRYAISGDLNKCSDRLTITNV